MRKFLGMLFVAGAFFVTLSSATYAQDMMAKDEKTKPIVAVIKADWCGYCKRVDPVLSKLMEDYGSKLDFVMFDVTDKDAIAMSMKKAKSLGLEEFFESNKEKTSTVAVITTGKVAYKTSNNTRREDYEKAFNAALN